MSKPKISLNKLGEYLQANAPRRKKIVLDAKEPNPFGVIRYSDAKDAIKKYIESGCDSNILDTSIESHETKGVTTDFQEQDKVLSIELLKSVYDLDLPDLSAFEVTSYHGANPKMEISGVEISINPDLIIRGKYKGKQTVGAIKLHTSKTNLLNEEGGKNVATMLKFFVENHIMKDDEKTSPKLCISVDIFGKYVETAPTSFKKRMKDITSACEEIALWWETL